MDIQIKAKFMNYLFRMLSGQYDHLPVGEIMDKDSEFIQAEYDDYFPIVSPEEVGISTETVLKLIKSLAGTQSVGLHGIAMIRHGKLFTEAYASPYGQEYRHISHSMCKSITSMAVGKAVEEGYINLKERLVDIFPERVNLLTTRGIKRIKVIHLLTMSSGIKFNELSTVFEQDWIKGYFESDVSFIPGSNFEYNSLNTYMLSVIIKKKTGKGLLEYITPTILKPLGITDVTWEKCPLGYEKGGWGVKLSLLDMAKLGQLYLQQGKWLVDGNMKEIISSNWITKSSTQRIRQTVDKASTGYGYQIWTLPNKGFVFNGMLGQNVFVFPNRDLVIAITAGSSTLFSDYIGTQLIKDFVMTENNFSEEPLPINKLEQYVCNASLANMEFMEKLIIKKPSFDEFTEIMFKKNFASDTIYKKYIKRAQLLMDKDFYFEEPIGSVMPILLQAMYNNYSKGITHITFLYFPDDFRIIFEETHTINEIKVGFLQPTYQEFHLNGQVFRIGTLGKFTTDEDGNVVLKIKISFIEQANTKIVKIWFLDNKIKLQLVETPRMDEILDIIIGEDSPILKRNLPMLNNSDYMRYRMDKFVSPWGYGFEK